MNNNSDKIIKNKDRKYKIEILNKSLEQYKKIGVSGEYGVGKTYLLNLFKKYYSNYIFIELNAYQIKDDVIKNLINSIKIDTKLKKLFEKIGFGRWLKNFSRLFTLLISSIFVGLTTLFGILYGAQKIIIDTVEWWVSLLLPVICFFIGISFIFLETFVNKYEIESLKDINFTKKIKDKIIIVVEDINRLEQNEQKKFFNEISTYFDKLNYENKNVIFLFDANFMNENDDWSKFIDHNINIINDSETVSIIIDEIIESNEIKNKEIKNYLNSFENNYQFFLSENISNLRQIKQFLKILDNYFNYKNFIQQVYMPDLFDFILLSIIDLKFYNIIIKDPHQIFSTNAFENIHMNNKEKTLSSFGKIFVEKATNDFRGNKYKIIDNYSWLENSILRYQAINDNKLFFWDNQSKKNEKTLMKVTDRKYFPFFKYPQYFDEYMKEVGKIKINLKNINNQNFTFIFNYFSNNIKNIMKFEDMDFKMFLDLTLDNFEFNQSSFYEKFIDELINFRFGIELLYDKFNYYSVLESYFLNFYKNFLVKDIIKLFKKSENKESFTLKDYQLIIIISDYLSQVEYINLLFNIDWNQEFEDKNERNEKLKKIEDFYKSFAIWPAILLTKESLDIFLDKINMISNNNKEFILNILKLDYYWCRLLCWSIYNSKYEHKISEELKKIIIENKNNLKSNEIAIFIKNKASNIYKDFINSNRYANAIYINYEFCREFFNDFEEFFK